MTENEYYLTEKAQQICKFSNFETPYYQDGNESSNASTVDSPPKAEYNELQYKRPRRVFRSKEERLNFVKNYQSKLKTEVLSILISD